MENSTLQNLPFSELRSKSKALSKMLYVVGAATMLSIFAMLYSILNTSGVGISNLVLGILALSLTIYLYALSNRDSVLHQEMWKRKFRK